MLLARFFDRKGSWMFECWTDGSYKPSSNCGGYSVIITKNGEIIKKLYRGYKGTTNNRMELLGVLECLKYFETPEEITIYSDSQYVVSSINNQHLFKWIEENDLSKKNLDLWRPIYELLKFHTVTFVWVKGHNNNKFNELADLYATHASDCLDLPEDNGLF